MKRLKEVFLSLLPLTIFLFLIIADRILHGGSSGSHTDVYDGVVLYCSAGLVFANPYIRKTKGWVRLALFVAAYAAWIPILIFFGFWAMSAFFGLAP